MNYVSKEELKKYPVGTEYYRVWALPDSPYMIHSFQKAHGQCWYTERLKTYQHSDGELGFCEAAGNRYYVVDATHPMGQNAARESDECTSYLSDILAGKHPEVVEEMKTYHRFFSLPPKIQNSFLPQRSHR